MLNDVHRRQAAGRDEALAKLHAQLEDSKAWRKAQAAGTRVARTVQAHERAQQSQRAESRQVAQRVDRAIAAGERRARGHAGPMPLAERLPAELRETLARLARLEEGSR